MQARIVRSRPTKRQARNSIHLHVRNRLRVLPRFCRKYVVKLRLLANPAISNFTGIAQVYAVRLSEIVRTRWESFKSDDS